MPPRINSRHEFTTAFTTAEGQRALSDRVPYRFQAFNDTRQHVVGRGDSLFTLAARYFSGFERGAGLWWAIADFQPDPILDPTLVLEEGRLMFIPSERTMREEILNPTRRVEF